MFVNFYYICTNERCELYLSLEMLFESGKQAV